MWHDDPFRLLGLIYLVAVGATVIGGSWWIVTHPPTPPNCDKCGKQMIEVWGGGYESNGYACGKCG